MLARDVIGLHKLRVQEPLQQVEILQVASPQRCPQSPPGQLIDIGLLLSTLGLICGAKGFDQRWQLGIRQSSEKQRSDEIQRHAEPCALRPSFSRPEDLHGRAI